MKWIKPYIPPIIVDIFRIFTKKYGYFGSYDSWDAARKESSGYDAGAILEKVKDATLSVLRGEAVFERDSITFHVPEYSWELLSCLLWIATKEKNTLRVVDFGGALGSTYSQHKKWFGRLETSWNIVEQEHFVKTGKELFLNSDVQFFSSIEDVPLDKTSSTIIFSSVLQYIERPDELLKRVMDQQFKYIIIDRTTFIASGRDRLVVQRVPPQIYEASYPCWFFDEHKLLDTLSSRYEVVCSFSALGGEIHEPGGVSGSYKGFFLKRKD